MEPEEVAREDRLHGHWETLPREWRATHDQQGKSIKWTTKPVKGDMEGDGSIMQEFKRQMAVVLRGAESIQNLKFKPAAMVKNFDKGTRKRFKNLSTAMFKKGTKELEKAARERDKEKGEKVDMVVRWGLNLAATRIFGTVKHWPTTSMLGIHNEEPEGRRQPGGLRREGKAALNRRYLGSVHKFHRWMYNGGASMANIDATMEELYDYALPSFSGDIVEMEQVPVFPQGEAYLRALWQSGTTPGTPFSFEEDEEERKVTKKMKKIITEGDGNRGPGYDQITYRILKQCEQGTLVKWLINTFKVQTSFRTIYPSYKLGFVSYIPKPGAINTMAPNLRPVTLLPVFFKILSKYITYRAYKAMTETIEGAYEYTPFTFQMGVNPGVAGCRDANLKLTAVLEDSRHKHKEMFCLFTDFKGAFTSLPLGVIMKTIDILPICPTLKRMWKETASGNQVRLVINGKATEVITITRGVAQGNTISPLTFAVVKETVAKWIAKECRGYMVAEVEIKGMDYMDDEVRIAGDEATIRKMAEIQSDFATWAGMKFGIHKCAYWGRRFVGKKGQEVILENFNLCNEAIPKLEGTEAFKYLGEHKAPASRVTNSKPTTPRVGEVGGERIHEGQRALEKYKARVAQLATPRIRKLHYAGKLDFLSQAARPLIEVLCPTTPPPNYILDAATRIQHNAARKVLGWNIRRGATRQFETSTNHLGLRLPNFRTIRDSMLVNTAFAYIHNLDPQVRQLFRHMAEEMRIGAGIPNNPQGKIFLNWDLAYGRTRREPNTQTEGLAYWEPTGVDPSARRKIGDRGRGKGRTYIAFLYHACQALGVRITAQGIFEVSAENGEVEGHRDLQKIGEDPEMPRGPNAQEDLDKDKLELKEYTKGAVRYRDGKELVHKIATSQFEYRGAQASGSRKWLRTPCLSMPEFKTMAAAAFNVLPVKSVVSTWHRRGQVNCTNCQEGKRETIKHLFCSCKHPMYEAIRVKRHDKVVSELYCWIKLRAEKGKLGNLANFQVWMADNSWGTPDMNQVIFPRILEDGSITHRRPDLIFQYKPADRRGGEVNKPHQIEIWEVSVVMDNAIKKAQDQKTERYQELIGRIKEAYPESEVQFRPMVIGVMGTVPIEIRRALREIQAQAQTSWVIHQIIQAVGNHNHKLWVVRDQMHNRAMTHPNEEPGTWVPQCRWLRREFFKYCENLEQREEWEARPREEGQELPIKANRTQIDKYYFKVMSNVTKWTRDMHRGG